MILLFVKMIVLQHSSRNMMQMVKSIAQNVLRLAILVLIQVSPEITNVLHAKKVTSQVQECLEYVIKFVKKVNSFIIQL